MKKIAATLFIFFLLVSPCQAANTKSAAASKSHSKAQKQKATKKQPQKTATQKGKKEAEIFKKGGDSLSSVREIQGAPDRSEVIQGETWYFYGSSYIRFDGSGKTKHVYNAGELKNLPQGGSS